MIVALLLSPFQDSTPTSPGFPQPAILNRLGEHRRQINRDSECAMAWRGIELKDRESADVMPPASCHCGEAVATR